MSYYINYPKWLSPFVFPFTTIIRWYSLMYLFAFATAFFLLRHILKYDQSRLKLSIKDEKDVELVLYVAVFLIIGARLGSCLIYSGTYYYKHPLEIFFPFKNGKFVGLGGMSYHGGIFGALLGGLIFSKVHKVKLVDVIDTLIVCIPFGYTWGRIGNFLNRELYGRVTTSSLGMMFPPENTELFDSSLPWVRDVMAKVGIESNAPFVNLPRYPSQLYEAFFEGIVIGCIMWFVIRPHLKKMMPLMPFGVYLTLHGLVRFFIEYLREPDSNLGFIIKGGAGSDTPYLFTSILNISMGQILCLIMVLYGVLIMFLSKMMYNKSRGKECRK